MLITDEMDFRVDVQVKAYDLSMTGYLSVYSRIEILIYSFITHFINYIFSYPT